MAALATVQDLEAVMGMTLTGDATRVERVEAVLDMASAVVRQYTGQFFELVTDDEVTLWPDTSGRYRLPERPVVSVSSTVGGDAVPVELYDAAWDLETGLLRYPRSIDGRYRYFWNSGPLVVTYTHGYATLPADVVMVVCSIASRQVSNPGQIRSEAVGDYSVTYTVPGTGEALGMNLSRPERAVLASYRWINV